MSKPTFNEGQEIVFGIDDGLFQESGFLHGATVRIVEARYGKMVVAAQYQDPKNPIPDRIGAKFKFAIKKQDGTEKILDRAQEYSTGIHWEGGTATVSPDGKKLLAKKDFKGFSKQTDFYHLLETAVNAGFAQDRFKGDLSVFDNLVFQIVSETNPRAGDKAKPKPFFGLLLNGSVGVEASSSVNTAAPASVALDDNTLTNGVLALTTMVAQTGTVTRREIASKVPPIADANGWNAETRVNVIQALFDLPRLTAIANAAGLKINGDSVSA